MTNLQMAVNGEYFDQMVNGAKKYEYRERTEYWKKRLEGRNYDTLIITKGYPSRDDKSRRIEIPYAGYVLMTITHPHFGNLPVDVYAINVDISQRK